jgi:hypothetical protein
MKNKNLIWIGLGTAVVVGVGLFFLIRGRSGKLARKQWVDAGSPATFEQWQKLSKAEKMQLLSAQTEIPAEAVSGGIKVGNTRIDLSKFKLDINEVMRILTEPVSKEKKYATLKESGVPDQTISLVKKADEAQQKKALSDTLKRLRKQDTTLIGIK